MRERKQVSYNMDEYDNVIRKAIRNAEGGGGDKHEGGGGGERVRGDSERNAYVADSDANKRRGRSR